MEKLLRCKSCELCKEEEISELKECPFDKDFFFPDHEFNKRGLILFIDYKGEVYQYFVGERLFYKKCSNVDEWFIALENSEGVRKFTAIFYSLEEVESKYKGILEAIREREILFNL